MPQQSHPNKIMATLANMAILAKLATMTYSYCNKNIPGDTCIETHFTVLVLQDLNSPRIFLIHSGYSYQNNHSCQCSFAGYLHYEE